MAENDAVRSSRLEQPDTDMDRIPDTTFESRRAAIWMVNRRWVFASAAAVALLVMFAGLVNAPRDLAWALALGAAVLLAVTVTRIVRALNALYRCPNCGDQPYQVLNEYKCGGLGPTRSNFMSPTHCPKCGTRLR
jgi:hypothetical protein